MDNHNEKQKKSLIDYNKFILIALKRLLKLKKYESLRAKIEKFERINNIYANNNEVDERDIEALELIKLKMEIKDAKLVLD